MKRKIYWWRVLQLIVAIVLIIVGSFLLNLDYCARMSIAMFFGGYFRYAIGELWEEAT